MIHFQTRNLNLKVKIDDSFPNLQFKIEGYKSFRKDRDVFGGGLLFYVNEKINCRSLEICLPNAFLRPYQ